MEAIKESLRSRVAQGGLEEARQLIESLAEELDVLDLAAAAIAIAGDGSERAPAPPAEAATPDRSGAVRLLRISVGKEDSVRPADLVGAIAGEAGISSSLIGAIKIHDDYSLAEIPEEVADQVIMALKKTKIRGHKVTVQSRPAR
jgi:ATP-dependent RNA helicase DeaD